MRIVNFVMDEKFIDGAISYNAQYSPINVRHTYIYVTDEPINHFTFIKNDTAIIQLRSWEIISYLNKNADAVLLHCLYSVPLDILPLIPRRICVIWSSWGYDIYGMIGCARLINRNLFRPLTKQFLMQLAETPEHPEVAYSQAVNRIDLISTILPEEYEMIQDFDFFHAKSTHYTYITPDEIEKYQQTESFQTDGYDILVGNSGAPTNNHLDIFEMLAQLELGESKIYCPLSYAGFPAEYKEHVVVEGHRLFGNRFIPLLDFIDKDAYFNVVRSCGYVIFGHIRQQALGNIREMIAIGSKVFLDSDSPMYKYFFNRGMRVFSIQKDLNQSQITQQLSAKDRKNNSNVLRQMNSPGYFHQEMKKLAQIAMENSKVRSNWLERLIAKYGHEVQNLHNRKQIPSKR